MRIADFAFEVKEGMAISFQAIRANKMRSALTTLGIIIGIVSVTLMGTAIEGLSRAFNESISKLGADVLYVQKWPWFAGDDWWKYRNRRDIKYVDFKAVEKSATLIQATAPAAWTGKPAKYQRNSSDLVFIIGTNERYLEIGGISMEMGRFFSQAESDGGRPVCAIGYEVAENLFPNESPLGKTIKLGAYAFRVVGVMEKQGSLLGLESLDNRVAVPIQAFFKRYGLRHGIQISVKAADINNLEDTKEELRGILRKARRLAPATEDDFSINQQEMFIQTFNTIGAVVAGIGLFICALSLFVGAIGIMNIMFVSVTERTKEIGIRKAIGARRNLILLQFLVESGSLSLLGGIIGIIISFPLSLIIDQFLLPTSMPLDIVGLALLISIVVGVVSGFLPAFRASKLDPVEALRYE